MFAHTPVQVVLSRIEDQIVAYQRQRQSRSNKIEVVDVQVGRKLYIDVPKEFRTRLWLAILEQPHLIEALGVGLSIVCDVMHI